MNLPVTCIIPCYNESARLDVQALLAFAGCPDVKVILVDDGSTDNTGHLLEQLCKAVPATFSSHRLAFNSGKAEAVRQGLLQALLEPVAAVAFLDADLATPVDEMLRLATLLENPGVDVVLGSRRKTSGAQIKRRVLRHLAGRVFAVCAQQVLRVGFHDTQCGAKVFRNTPALQLALAQPFLSQWAFDVELLARLLYPASGVAIPVAHIVEEPLRVWIDKPPSKVTWWGGMKAFIDLARIRQTLRTSAVRNPAVK